MAQSLAPARFSPSVLAAMARTRMSVDRLGRIRSYHSVVARFHLMTPAAIQRLNNDWLLLGQINRSLSQNQPIPQDVLGMMASRGFYVVVHGDPMRPNFYAVSLKSRREMALLERMQEDFKANPDFTLLPLEYRAGD